MTTLAEIEHEIANILCAAEELPEETEPVALEYLDQLAVQETDKVDGIVYALRKRQSEVAFLQEEEGRLKKRRKAIENRMDAFKDYLAFIFQREGIQKIQGVKGTLYLRESSKVEIQDVNEIPAEYVDTEVRFVPRKKDIYKVCKDGGEVPGASLTTKQNLIVR